MSAPYLRACTQGRISVPRRRRSKTEHKPEKRLNDSGRIHLAVLLSVGAIWGEIKTFVKGEIF